MGQDFNVHSQLANNVQPWNESISPTRRYVIVHLSPEKKVDKVRVISGERLDALDTKKTRTTKFQASFIKQENAVELLSRCDTEPVSLILKLPSVGRLGKATPVDYPRPGELLAISTLYQRLKPLVGKTFPDRGVLQARNRGGDLQRLTCATLGYQSLSRTGPVQTSSISYWKSSCKQKRRLILDCFFPTRRPRSICR